MAVNIVAPDNGKGLSVDICVLADTLTGQGHRVYFRGGRHQRGGVIGSPRIGGRVARKVRKHFARLRRRPMYDVTLFLEGISPAYLGEARRDILVPNPEFNWGHQDHLSRVHEIWCKTESARRIFTELGYHAERMGFTCLPEIGSYGFDASEKKRRFLHIAGGSTFKGTKAVVELWWRRPDLPTLTVVQSPTADGLPNPVLVRDPPENIFLVTKRLSRGELTALQATHWYHVLPSEIEGFGHTLVEALALGSVPITTDAPPMNEIVRPERGLLVAANSGSRMGYVHRWNVKGEELEKCVDLCLQWSLDELRSCGMTARAWYKNSRANFQLRLNLLVSRRQRPR